MAITKLSDSSITTGDKYISMLAGNLPTGNYESIATVTVGSGGSSSIQFTSIPQTYTHLQLRGIERTTYASNVDSTYIVINGVGSGVFNYHTLRTIGDGSTASAYGASAIIGFQAGAGANNTAGVFSGVIIDILDYTNTNKYKTIRNFQGFDNNGNGNIGLYSTLYMDTAAITSIYIENGAGNHAQYTQYALYGIKGA